MDGASHYKRAIENDLIPRTEAGDLIAGTLEKIGGESFSQTCVVNLSIRNNRKLICPKFRF